VNEAENEAKKKKVDGLKVQLEADAEILTKYLARVEEMILSADHNKTLTMSASAGIIKADCTGK